MHLREYSSPSCRFWNECSEISNFVREKLTKPRSIGNEDRRAAFTNTALISDISKVKCFERCGIYSSKYDL